MTASGDLELAGLLNLADMIMHMCIHCSTFRHQECTHLDEVSSALVSLCLPEQHDVLPQLLDGAWGLHVCLGIKALGERMHNVQLAQGLSMGLQSLIAAGHRLSALQPARCNTWSWVTLRKVILCHLLVQRQPG